jgi:hypothetical protein
MPLITDDSIEQLADLIAAALKNLNENLIRVTQNAGNALSGVVPTRLLQNQFDLVTVKLTRRATYVETLDKHGGLSS